MKKRKLILPIVALLMGFSVGGSILNISNKSFVKNVLLANETTGTINFGNNAVKINGSSVTGNDSLGNTWTITTEGTTSYTGSTTYYQVGSGNKPATSITFTTTLDNTENISTFSAKFGGFNGTAGTVTLKVGDTTVGTGSLNATNDVTITNSSAAQGSVLTVTVTGIAKGVKVYFISYGFSEQSENAKTVTFNDGTKNIKEVSVDENSYLNENNLPINRGYRPVLYSTYNNGNFSDPFNYENERITADITIYVDWVKVDATNLYHPSVMEDEDGNEFRIIGEVIAKVNAKTFYIQDGDNAMPIYDAVGTYSNNVSVGNTVDLYGTYNETNKNISSLAYCDITSNDTTISQVSLSDYNNPDEVDLYKYISVSSLRLASGFLSNRTASIDGSDTILYYGNKEFVNGNSFEPDGFSTNNYVTVTGVLLDFNGTKEITLSTISLLTSYTVTFLNWNGEEYHSDVVLGGTTVTLPTDPIRDTDQSYSYSFDGWYKEDDSVFDESTPINENLVLHAVFTPTLLTPEESVANTLTKTKLNYFYTSKSETNVNFSEQGFENGDDVPSVVEDDYTISFVGGKYYDTGSAIRVYGGKSFTISSENIITKITLTFGSGDGSNTITTDVGTYANGTWSGAATSITFNIGGTSGHRRIASVTITPQLYTFSNVNLNFGAIVTKENYNSIFDGASTKKIGVVFARTSKLAADNKTIEQALTANASYIGKTEVDPAVTTPFTTDSTGALDGEGAYYSWSVSLAVPTLDAESNYTEAFLTESITAVAYMYAEDHYVFFGERAMSVAQAAEAYKSHSVYTGGTAMTRATLDYLAALDD